MKQQCFCVFALACVLEIFAAHLQEGPQTCPQGPSPGALARVIGPWTLRSMMHVVLPVLGRVVYLVAMVRLLLN